MADKADEKREEKKVDSAEEPKGQGEKLDKILSHLDSLHTKHDALHEGHEELRRRMDALEEHVGKNSDAKKDEAKKDESGAEEERAEAERKEEKKEAKEEKKDSAKKDAAKKDGESGDDDPEKDKQALKEEREENKLKANDKRKHDADEGDKEPGSKHHDSIGSLSEQLAAAQAQIKALEHDIAGKGRDAFVATQSQADRVYAAFGDSAPRWMTGEPHRNYRVRLLTPMQKHCAGWKDKDLSKIPEDFLDIAEAAVYHDALEAAGRSDAGPEEGLQEVFDTDRAGRRISRFRGHPEACWGQFKLPVKYVQKFNIARGADAR